MSLLIVGLWKLELLIIINCVGGKTSTYRTTEVENASYSTASQKI